MLWFLLSAQVFANTPPTARLDSDWYLKSARYHYEHLNYEKALGQLAKADALAADDGEASRVALFSGIVLADWGKTVLAERSLHKAFALDPTAQLPVQVSPKIVGLAKRAKSAVVLGKQLPARGGGMKACAEGVRDIESFWNEARRQETFGALKTAADPEISAVAPTLLARLDSWANRWGDIRLALCIRQLHNANAVKARASQEACFTRAKTSFVALLKIVGDGRELGKATQELTQRLPDPNECTQSPREPLVNDVEAQQLREALTQARAYLDVGRTAEGRALFEKAATLSESSSTPLLRAELAAVRALVLVGTGTSTEIIAAYEQAASAFLEANAPRGALEALIALIPRYPPAPRDFERSQASYELAQRLLKRNDEILLEVRLLEAWAYALDGVGKIQSAMQVLKRAQRLADKLEPTIESAGAKADLFTTLGVTTYDLGLHQEAVAHFDKATQLVSTAFGDSSFKLISVWSNQAAIVLDAVGDLESAESYATKAVALAEALKWPPGKAAAYSNLGHIQLLTKRFDLAQQLLAQRVEYVAKKYGPESQLLILDLTHLGAAERALGRLDRALSAHQRALAVAKPFHEAQRARGHQTDVDMVTIELARDAVALDDWSRVAEHVRECDAARREQRLDADLSLWCEIVGHQLAWSKGQKAIAVSGMKALAQSSVREEGLLALNCAEARAFASEWLAQRGR